ncbi:hypothetical protein [Nitratifractor salsuginis]|uniref:Uncharacterized protein n=1 Tax=Nitratifractor salsuginis (strain DSM 16511 / JCM 12458 / E9I37-1) TaxID=749222 RepID=E6X164_NITSE|nr:hypothetical protein [Nitratifractor salsuginis]ADV45867.1 hypothetical protein Nitsa_0599 [Nitratifractor salsuginis DSM 16511]
MDYTEAIIWYLSWPLLIYITYRFVWLNIRHHQRMERLEELEEHYGKVHDEKKAAQNTAAKS